MDGQPDFQRVGADIRVVDVEGGPSHQRRDVGDPKARQTVRVRLLGADRRDVAVGEQAAQLILRRHGEDPHPRLTRRRVDRRSPQVRRLDELDILTARRAVVVAGDSVDSGGGAGHDRDVIRVGEARHVATAKAVGTAVGQHGPQARHQSTVQARIEIGRRAAVDRDSDGRPARRPIVAAVDGYELSRHQTLFPYECFFANWTAAAQPDPHGLGGEGRAGAPDRIRDRA